MKKIAAYIFIFLSIFLVHASGQKGERNFVSPTIPGGHLAKSTWSIDAEAGTVTIRTTFSKNYIDNTYGSNSIGWAAGHSFDDLLRFDKMKWVLKDGSGQVKLAFEQDYISADKSFSSGFGCLGFSGSGSVPTIGRASDILHFQTSLATNLNEYGYRLTSNSPSSDNSYTPNPSYPNWIYDVWYEVTVKLSAFGKAGFGYPDIYNVNTGKTKTGPIKMVGELKGNYVSFSGMTNEVNTADKYTGGGTLSRQTTGGNLSLGNLVWDDVNTNGVKDATETGMANLRVRLYQDANADNVADGPAIDSTLTNASGIYGFSNLAAGKYIVGVVLPPMYMATVGIPSSFDPDNDVDNDNNGVVTINSSEVRTRYITLSDNGEPTNDGDDANGNQTLDIGLFVCGDLVIGDYVWDDTNGNGLQDVSEFGIPGVKVTLELPDGSIYITYTDANGYYYFTGLHSGTYTVKFETPAGYRPTISNNGPDDRDSDPVNGEVTVMLSTAPGNLTIDAGFVLVKMNLGNLVFNDLNKNGVKDPGEPGLSGLTVNLYTDTNADNIPDGAAIATTITDGTGNYSFTNLLAGKYIVGVKIDTSLWSNGPIPFSGINPNNDVDNDNNGIITSNSEIFSFYITLSPGTEPINDGDGADGNLTFDFGLVTCSCSLCRLNLGNTIFIDANNNGLYDAGESGLGNVRVYLYKDDNADNIPDGPAIDSTISSSGDGSYGFNHLADGKYIVGIVPPGLYSIGAFAATSLNPDNDIDNDNNGVVLVAGEVRSNFITLLSGTEPTNDGDDSYGNLSLDFGVRPGSGGSTSFIGDRVWQDYNKNGIQDPGEPGFADVIVKLTLPGGSIITTTTNSNGMYGFSNLQAGTYTVCFVTPHPMAFFPSPAGVGGDVTKDSDPVNGCVTLTLGAGEIRTDIDAGFYDDIDDDDDGIPDLVEGHGYDGLMDCDGDGIPNYMDPTPGCPTPPGLDIYGNPFKPLVWSDCPRPGFPAGDGINDFFDHDNDGVIDQLDLDSDNDGILDAYETRDPRLLDVNRDGMVDGGDDDGDGLLNSADLTPNSYGGPGLFPQDLDRDGIPNYLDLDSDGDGITDLTEAREFFDNDGLADGVDTDGDGVNDVYDQIVGRGARGVELLDRDNDGKPNPYDIDSDNDGITDNVEGQPTCSERQPSGIDADGDGLDDIYDINISSCIRKGAGITPFDKDGDGTPDIYDLDTDNDGAPDVNEGSGKSGNFVTNFADTDGDGLIDEFDIFNILTATEKFHHNVAHSEMGPNGNFDGPVPPGSNALVPGFACSPTDANKDRHWRSVAVLPVSLLEFRGNLNNNVVKLDWKVTNEVNLSHYNVQRSIDGQSFANIGKVSAKNISGISDYVFTNDVSSLDKTTVYYRLQQVDKNGEFKYSNIIAFKLTGKEMLDMVVYPNPASEYFTIKVKSAKETTASFRILDIMGRTLLMQTSRLSIGTNAINFDDLEKLAPGTYTIQAIINGEVFHQKLLVSK